MTDLQLGKLGIVPDKSKLKPNRYFCNTRQEFVDILKGTTVEMILNDIIEVGRLQGIEEGKNQRNAQFRDLLDGKDLNNF